MKRFCYALLAIAIGYCAARFMPRDPAPGDLLQKQPLQKFRLGFPIKFKGWTLFPIAKFQVDAQILGCRLYLDDPVFSICPVDLALGWGPMADRTFSQQVTVTQEGRFYYWQAKHSMPREDISLNSSNFHLIPATPSIQEQLEQLSPGQYISLKGRLVNITAPDGSTWTTSINRTDRGAGACEILYVEHAALLNEWGETLSPTPSLTHVIQLPRERPSITPAPRETVVLKSPLYIKQTYGSVTVPAKETLTVMARERNRQKIVWRGFEFWVAEADLRQASGNE